jgi:hypothetical protein
MFYTPKEAFVIVHFEQDIKPVIYQIDYAKLFHQHPLFGLISLILFMLIVLMVVLDGFDLELNLSADARSNLAVFMLCMVLFFIVGAYSLLGDKGSNLAYQQRFLHHTGEENPELLAFYAHVYQDFFECSSKEDVQKYVQISPLQERFWQHFELASTAIKNDPSLQGKLVARRFKQQIRLQPVIPNQ